MKKKTALVVISCMFAALPAVISNINNIVKVSAEEETLPNYYCLRDEYIHYTQNQTNTGLCWSYGSHFAFSTTYQKATGEYTEFSEVWTSMTYSKKTGSYVPNAGGSFTNFTSVTPLYGLVYDQDLPTTKAWLQSKAEVDTFIDFYDKYANNIIYQNLTQKYFNARTQKEQIKQHILDNGAVYLAATWQETIMKETLNGNWVYVKTPKQQGVSGAHAVAIMGWDDDISIDFDGTVWTGAWIVQNSFGEREEEQYGSTYIFYDDTNVWSGAYGFTFTDKTSETTGIDFIPYITESSANIINHKAGTFSYDKNIHDEEIKTKNVFYSQDMDITYQYTISSDTTIDDIAILNSDVDVTYLFDIDTDFDNKKITIKNYEGFPLDYGSYKVVYTLNRDGNTEYGYSTFFIMSGGEVNTVFLEELDGESVTSQASNVINHGGTPTMIDNNGYYFLHNSHTYSPNERDIKLATYNTSGSIKLKYYINMLNDIDHIEVDYETVEDNVIEGTNEIVINYEGLCDEKRTLNKKLDFVTKHDTRYSVDINIDYAKEDEHYVYMRYDTNGGYSVNHEKELFVEGSPITLKPGYRPGYEFNGWYYDEDLTEPLEYSEETGDYTYSYDKLNKLPEWASTNNYCYVREKYYYNNLSFATVYAKWHYVGLNSVSINYDQEVIVGREFKFNVNLEGIYTPAQPYDIQLEDNGVIVDTFNSFDNISHAIKDPFSHYFRLRIYYSISDVTYEIDTDYYQILAIYLDQQVSHNVAWIASAGLFILGTVLVLSIIKKSKKDSVK